MADVSESDGEDDQHFSEEKLSSRSSPAILSHQEQNEEPTRSEERRRSLHMITMNMVQDDGSANKCIRISSNFQFRRAQSDGFKDERVKNNQKIPSNNEGNQVWDKLLRRPTWYDTDVPSLSSTSTANEENLKELNEELEEELKIQPETAINLDSIVSKEATKANKNIGTTSLGWLGKDTDPHDSHKSTASPKSIRRPTWYDDNFIIGMEEDSDRDDVYSIDSFGTELPSKSSRDISEQKLQFIKQQHEAELPPEFHRNFSLYAYAAGDALVADQSPLLSLAALNRWLEDANILNHETITVIHTGLCFNKTVLRERGGLRLQELLKFLQLICHLGRKPLVEMINALSCEFLKDLVTFSKDSGSF